MLFNRKKYGEVKKNDTSSDEKSSEGIEVALTGNDEQEIRTNLTLFNRKKHVGAKENLTEDRESSEGVEVREEDGNDEQVALPLDIFSLFFVSPVFSAGFVYSMSCFALQIGIHFLVLYNLLRDAPEGNPLKVPLRVEQDVAAAQILALLVSLVTQEDVITTLDMIPVGYNNDVLKTSGSATRVKWGISDLMRLFEGILSIMVSFIFIIQSTEVLDLFLNFAAVQFISMLDNIGFQLAHNGYITNGLVTLAKRTKTIRFPRKKQVSFCGSKCKVPSFWILRFIFVLAATGLYAGWAHVRIQQASGFYLSQVCQNFNIRFGDQYYDFFVSQPCNIFDGCPWKNRTRPLHYGPFSDLYQAAKDGNGNLDLDKNGRPVYYQRGRQQGFGDGSPPGKFSYCESEGAWVFTIQGVTKPVTDSCDWLMRSPRASSDAYSLHEAPSYGWSIWTGVLTDDPIFEISCGECETNVDCNYHGTCIGKQCVCEKPWTGSKCQTCAACTKLSSRVKLTDDCFGDCVDEAEFFQLQGALAYDRPVYYKNGTNLGSLDTSGGYKSVKEPSDTTIEVLFYAGTRYYIAMWDDIVSDPQRGLQDSDLDRLASIFQDFHSTWNLDDNPNRTIAFYTEATTNPMPIEVKWNIVEDAPLSIYSGFASGQPTPIDEIDFDCAIEKEKTQCAFQSSSKSFR
mmetsp:Transcript_54379/g.80914  ORF Transcript_54379/g.80914 Transcript_54379/m.80914 type:complete len:680 (-) Transcript_54379:324-2363(-)